MIYVDRQKLIRFLVEKGFQHDVEGISISVYRNTRFPFQRIPVPTENLIAVPLLKLFEDDLEVFLEELWSS
ncbi:MAG: hypothetical protein WAN36_10800 [Calditrichia bacterium]